MAWREITFTYEVPEGVDADDLESEMADVLALFAGCQHGDSVRPDSCASWVFGSKPVNMDCECPNEECPCGCGSFACPCPSECRECA